ncbi:metal-binding protein [Thermococcus chitonophagus]|uniref:Metal-binding protein n=1 Tax=Thermococcus chitonophagus TaxID=54262 RepID=A0A160VTE6_9EURY|nr:DUF2284 domain-containing protein [Thermococcus chitonophagus]ASJ16895.1 metal-binding protein [Thermococcus chitonophagus]CUX78375.1 hypothetical protein CHITON_1596 [Thermococcus chitonophagus]
MEVVWEREIDASSIVVSPRPVWKCMACPMYGKRPSCPPHVPSWRDTVDLIKHYKKALLVKFKINTEDFEKEKRRILLWLLEKEKEYFRNGYPYAIALFPGNCNLCEECTFETTGVCKMPEKVRPSVDAVGIELTSIVTLDFNEPVLYGLILID